MTELRLTHSPPRPELRRQLRGALGRLGRPLRVLAEDIAGLESPIDLVAVDPRGRVVLVLVGEEGEDLELVANGLAQRAWLEPRLGDWRKLAPELEIRPDQGVGLLLVAPGFGPRALTAAAADAQGIALARSRFVETARREPPRLLLETLRPVGANGGADRPGASAGFRTGLSDEDLGLTPDEAHDFE